MKSMIVHVEDDIQLLLKQNISEQPIIRIGYQNKIKFEQ